MEEKDDRDEDDDHTPHAGEHNELAAWTWSLSIPLLRLVSSLSLLYVLDMRRAPSPSGSAQPVIHRATHRPNEPSSAPTLSSLPPDAVRLVFGFLSLLDQCRSRLVCRAWRRLGAPDSIVFTAGNSDSVEAFRHAFAAFLAHVRWSCNVPATMRWSD